MNTMLADSLDWIADKLEVELASGKSEADAVADVLEELMELHGNVIFGGDGYSSEWHTAAVEERGLRNIPTTADALPAFLDGAVIELFERTGVLSPAELESRYEVYFEQYILSIGVEARTTAELAKTVLYPAAMAYVSDLVGTIGGAAAIGVEFETAPVKVIGEEADLLIAAVAALESTPRCSEPGRWTFPMRFPLVAS